MSGNALHETVAARQNISNLHNSVCSECSSVCCTMTRVGNSLSHYPDEQQVEDLVPFLTPSNGMYTTSLLCPVIIVQPFRSIRTEKICSGITRRSNYCKVTLSKVIFTGVWQKVGMPNLFGVPHIHWDVMYIHFFALCISRILGFFNTIPPIPVMQRFLGQGGTSVHTPRHESHCWSWFWNFHAINIFMSGLIDAANWLLHALSLQCIYCRYRVLFTHLLGLKTRPWILTPDT